MAYLYVFIGGGLGSIARYAITRLAVKFIPSFPMGTLLANLLGTFLIGVFSVVLIERSIFQYNFPFRELIIVGFLGGLTTFSSFMLDSYNISIQKNLFHLFLYLTGNTVLGIFILIVGKYLAKSA